MSISATLSSALSGLTATARAAEIVSSNVANALTEGYARRELELGARRVGDEGQGVQVNGVKRMVDMVLLSDRRLAEAGAADRDAKTGFLQRLERSLGTADQAFSLVGRVAAFDAALITAASQPQSEARLSQLADTARSLAATFRQSSADLQAARSTADAQIAAEVNEVNRALVAISALNGQIVSVSSDGRDTSALQDQRQQLIDRISPIIPLREIQRENGRVALYTIAGAALLDGRPVKLDFSPAGVITADMSRASAALSGLAINGQPVRSDAKGAVAGGSLSAHFAIRDELAPEAQATLDALARDLIARFADPGLAPAGTGLFTDAGQAYQTGNETGLAARISLNPSVTPENGGALWRLRDGLAAVSPGPPGDATTLNAMRHALTTPRMTASGPFSQASRSFADLVAQLSTDVATDRLNAETEASFATARLTVLHDLELQQGVDTDREMQDLLLIEQAYAANARVIQTVDDMIKILLGM